MISSKLISCSFFLFIVFVTNVAQTTKYSYDKDILYHICGASGAYMKYPSMYRYILRKGKIIIDNDAGGDDAMAIFMSLLYEKYFDGPEIIGLTTGNGNTDEDKVCINNQRILKVAKRQDVPIYRGSKRSIVTTPSISFWYGKDGLGDDKDEEQLKELVPPQNQKAVEALIEQSKQHSGNLTVITIGTLTNVALAIKIDPDFIKRLNHLYIGAGHIHDDVHSSPEFNAHMDVEAYHIVTQHAGPDKVTIFPFSTTKNTLNIEKEWRQNIFGAIDTDIVRAMNRFEKVALDKVDSWASLDPSVIAVVLRPDLVEEYKFSRSGINLCGDKRGLTTNELTNEKQNANVRIVYKVKANEYKQFLIELFSAELKPADKRGNK